MTRPTRPIRPGGKPKRTAAPRLKEMLRVDHAGEYAAVAIYDAQSKVFGRSPQNTKNIPPTRGNARRGTGTSGRV